MSDVARVLPWGQDEAELVTELQGGSDTAFDWLVTHYHTAVYNLMLRMIGDAGDAADVTQEVFLKAFRGIGGFRQGSSLKTWLYRIAIREALNHRRWWWRHRRQQTSIDAETEDSAPLDLQDLRATPFDELAAREIQAAVRQALKSVPGVFRSAVLLRDIEGLSYEEVAEVLDVSVGTVKSRILRGRRALREVLEPLLAPIAKAAETGESPAMSGSATQNGNGHTNGSRAAAARGVAFSRRRDSLGRVTGQPAESSGVSLGARGGGAR